MNQTRLESALEVSVSIATGFAINFVASIFIYPAFGATFTWADYGWISVLFTVISVVRSYVWRRFFNAGIHKQVHALARRLYR